MDYQEWSSRVCKTGVWQECGMVHTSSDAFNSFSCLSIVFACCALCWQCCSLLVKHFRADVNWINHSQQSALMLAVTHDFDDIAKVLLKWVRAGVLCWMRKHQRWEMWCSLSRFQVGCSQWLHRCPGGERLPCRCWQEKFKVRIILQEKVYLACALHHGM